jgi:hypothetical protein
MDQTHHLYWKMPKSNSIKLRAFCVVARRLNLGGGGIRFVLKKEELQKLQLGLSQVGIWLSVALSSAVVKTLMSGGSKSPQVDKK